MKKEAGEPGRTLSRRPSQALGSSPVGARFRGFLLFFILLSCVFEIFHNKNQKEEVVESRDSSSSSSSKPL